MTSIKERTEALEFIISLDKVDVTKITWAELNAIVEKIHQSPLKPVRLKKSEFLFISILNLIEMKPITPESITELIKTGWRIIPKENGENLCDTDQKTIFLDISADPYERDKALCHELVHAFYDNSLDDSRKGGGCYKRANSLMAEWLARRLRANPEFLRRAILEFGLEPIVYDQASFKAFPGRSSGIESQLAFPFAQEYLSSQRAKLETLLMD